LTYHDIHEDAIPNTNTYTCERITRRMRSSSSPDNTCGGVSSIFVSSACECNRSWWTFDFSRVSRNLLSISCRASSSLPRIDSSSASSSRHGGLFFNMYFCFNFPSTLEKSSTSCLFMVLINASMDAPILSLSPGYCLLSSSNNFSSALGNTLIRSQRSPNSRRSLP